MSRQINSLKKCLSEHRVGKGEVCTHTTKRTDNISFKDSKGNNCSVSWSAGSYFIEKSDISSFQTHYCNAVRRGCSLTVTEKAGLYAPLRVDFDFKIIKLKNGDKRVYNFESLKKIVLVYQEEIKKILGSGFSKSILTCIILEKSSQRIEEQFIKDGVHLHFPHFICEQYVQDNIIHDNVMKRFMDKTSNCWPFWDYISPTECIDTAMFKKPWMMYGSMNYKNENSEPYIYNRWDNIPQNQRYGHILDSSLKEISPKVCFKEELDTKKRPNDVKFYFPQLLSVIGHPLPSELSPQTMEKINSLGVSRNLKRKRPKKAKMTQKDEVEVLEELKKIEDEELLSMLRIERLDKYETWLHVGLILFNISHGHSKGLNMWIEISKISDNFKEGGCEEHWDHFVVKNVTIGSLIHIVKEDSAKTAKETGEPDRYQQLMKNRIDKLIEDSLLEATPKEYDISLVFSKMFGDIFICADVKKDIWYKFEGHYWKEMSGDIELRGSFLGGKGASKSLLGEYVNFRRRAQRRLADVEADFDIGDGDENFSLKEEKTKLQRQVLKCSKVISELKSDGFLKKLVRMCQVELYNSKFLKMKDENAKLMACENGVLDLESGPFRPGIPDDYITLSTGINYVKYNYDDEDVSELNEYLLKVYPNKNRRKYFLDFFASCLEGGNIHKRFLIALGGHDGAKSMTFTLLQKAFGLGNDGYFGTFPNELFLGSSGKTNSAQARPELERARGKRIMSTSEITGGRANIDAIKLLSGNDAMFSRGLRQGGNDSAPKYKLCLQTNKMFRIPGEDEDTWPRIRILDHESYFVKPQDLYKYPIAKTFKKQLQQKRFPADPEFGLKLDDLAPVLLWRLFETYKQNKGKTLIEPKEVTESTDKQQSKSDKYKQYISERIIRIDDAEIAASKTSDNQENNTTLKDLFITLATLHSDYQEWHIENYPGYKARDPRDVFKINMIRRLGEIKRKEDTHGFGPKNRFYGYRFNDEDEDIFNEEIP